MLAGPPKGPVQTPDVVLKIAGPRSVEPVWLNQVGGVTFRLASQSEALYLKWAPLESPVNHEIERRKLEWAIAYTQVPRVLDSGTNSEGSWLLTEAIPADNAVAPRWKADPQQAVIGIGRGSRPRTWCTPRAPVSSP
jgi:kanamycin kinase